MASITTKPVLDAQRPKTAAPTGVRASVDTTLLGNSAKNFEMNRLTDTVKQKDKVIDQQLKEISSLKSNISVLQRTLQTKQSQMDSIQDKAAQALGAQGATSKELTLVKADKKKLEGQVTDLMRANARLKEQLDRAGEKNPGLSHQLASLQATVRSAQKGQEAAQEETRGLVNTLRAKDKELDRMSKLVEEARVLVDRNGELENRVRELCKQLDTAGEALRASEGLVRTRETDIARLNKELSATHDALSAANAAHANTNAELKAMLSRCGELDAEASRLRDENARVGAVAARVAASEVRNGSKDEGTVPVMQHLREVQYWQAEASRLKEKLSSLEKQLSIADELKNQYRCAAERLSQGPASVGPSSIPGSPRASLSGLIVASGQGSESVPRPGSAGRKTRLLSAAPSPAPPPAPSILASSPAPAPAVVPSAPAADRPAPAAAAMDAAPEVGAKPVADTAPTVEGRVTRARAAKQAAAGGRKGRKGAAAAAGGVEQDTAAVHDVDC